MRYILEGTWSGYNSNQARIVHRTIETSQKRIEALKQLHCIQYTDGTCLYLDIREARPREKVVEIKGYSSLINQCLQHKVNKVAKLPR